MDMGSSKSPDSSSEGNLEQMRGRVANGALILLSVMAIPGLSFSLYRITNIGWQPVMGLHIVAACVVWCFTLFRHRFSARVKGCLIVGIIFLLSIGGFLNLALSGAGYPMLIASTVLATVLLGGRGGVLLAVAGFALILAMGYGYSNGILGLRLDLNAYSLTGTSWIAVLAGYGLIAGATIAGVVGLHRALIKSTEDLVRHRDFLDDEVARRTRELEAEVAERREAEERLKTSQERYHTVVENQTELISKLRPDGTFTFVNDAYCRFVGKKEGDLIGQSVFDTVPDEECPALREYFLSFSLERPHQVTENAVQSDTGEVRMFEWSNTAAFDDEGAVVEIQSVGRDITERKNAEDALAESETRYHTVVENQTELITKFLPDGTFTFVNDAYCQFVDKSEEELIGSSLYDPVPEEEREALREYFSSFSPSLTHQQNKNELTSVAGERRFFEWYNSAAFDADGNIVELQSVGRDITERRIAELALAESETRFRDFAEISSDWFWETDAAHRLTFLADRFKDSTGLDPDIYIGKNRKELAAEKTDNAKWRKHTDELKKRKPFRDFQYECKTAHDAKLIISVSGNPMYDEFGEFVGYRGTATNITERQRARRALEESEERSRSMVEMTPDAILVVVDGKIVFVNPAAVRIFDAGRSTNLIGQSLMGLVHPDFRIMAKEHREKNRANGSVDVHELEMMTLGGDSFPCEIAAVVIPWEDTEASFVMLRDITDRREVDKLKTEFVSLVSHELRTPLTSIMGSIGLMEGGALGELPQPVLEMLKLAKSNTERLTSLVNDILDFEKLQSGGMEFSFDDIDLVELIKKSLDLNDSYAERFGVCFKFEDNVPATRVSADSDRLQQVMTNLLSNAAKFSPEGREIRISLEPSDGWIRVKVRDHGEGIPEEFRDVLFERFTQADTGLRRNVKGTGLGLSISRGIIMRHGGQIGYEPNEGGGSIFYFDLPLAIAQGEAVNS